MDTKEGLVELQVEVAEINIEFRASLAGFIDRLTKILQDIPPESRGGAEITVRAWDDYTGTIYVRYSRPEWDAEKR